MFGWRSLTLEEFNRLLIWLQEKPYEDHTDSTVRFFSAKYKVDVTSKGILFTIKWKNSVFHKGAGKVPSQHIEGVRHDQNDFSTYEELSRTKLIEYSKGYVHPNL